MQLISFDSPDDMLINRGILPNNDDNSDSDYQASGEVELKVGYEPSKLEQVHHTKKVGISDRSLSAACPEASLRDQQAKL